MNVPVVWINLFSVPKSKETEFLTWWADVRDTTVTEPGFVSGRLYRSVNEGATYNFINVAQWENELYAQNSESSIRTRSARLTELGIQTMRNLFIFSEYSAILS